MKKTLTIKILFLALTVVGCKQKFEPDILKSNPALLVVDGFLNNSSDSTFIRLSRTRKLSEGLGNSGENNALLAIEDVSGNPLYYFQAFNNDGVYTLPGMALDVNTKYRLRIITVNGNQYLSDELPVSNTPPIDSISWKRTNDGVTIYANTHDPSGKTKYYRWDYTETWQYNPQYYSTVKYEGGRIIYRAPAELIYDCWKTQNSTELLLASSAKLSQDKIYEKPLRMIATHANEISVKYSILVRQYALTETAFLYLENLKKITEQMGSVFDAQPSQLNGNIHALNNPSEPVLGYMIASGMNSRRIFIKNSEVLPWIRNIYCEKIKVPGDSLQFYFGQMGLLPIDLNMADGTVDGAAPVCVDCRERGGTLTRPDFWQ